MVYDAKEVVDVLYGIDKDAYGRIAILEYVLVELQKPCNGIALRSEVHVCPAVFIMSQSQQQE